MTPETSEPVPVADQSTSLTVHVDTSLIIEQQKAPVKANPVREALKSYAMRSTSSFARKEFKRAWLQDLHLVYKCATGCSTITEVYTAIHRSAWHPQAHRRLSRCLDAVAAHLAPHGKLTLEAAVPRLVAYLGEAILGAYDMWERTYTHECRGTGCVRAFERPTRALNGAIDVSVPKCKPSKIQCSVHRFFTREGAAFGRIEQAILAKGDTASTELKRTATTIRAARRDPEYLCDNRNCTAMSDALIAVDGLSADHFAANNDKDWKTIAAALGKPLLNPVQGTLTNPIEIETPQEPC